MNENEFGSQLSVQTDDFESRNYSEEILAVIRSGKSDSEIADGLADYHDNDIADIVPTLTPEERRRLYGILGPDAVSDIFAYLDDVEVYIEEMGADKAADVIESMDADDAIDVLDELDEDKRNQLMQLIEPEAKEDIELIHSYDEDQYGSIMTTNFIVIGKSVSIKEAMKSLVEQAAENDNISTIYVLDDDNTFYGAIDLTDLIVARKDIVLETLVTTSYPYVYDNESISSTIEQLKDYSEDSIPVLSSENKTVIGVITSQDIVEIVDEEMGEDYAKLAGLTAEEDLNEPLFMSIKKRIPWLIVLLVLGLGISTVIGAFQTVVMILPVIICFQSMILDMSGNTGTQSLAVTIRVISDDVNLPFKKRLGLIFKEIRVALCNGIILGSSAVLLTGLYMHFVKSIPLASAFTVSSCVGLSLCLAMIIAGFTGTAIPLILKRFNVDPAVASGPLITTVNDFVAVMVYYGISLVLLINTFHVENLID